MLEILALNRNGMLLDQSPVEPTDVHDNEACERQLGTSANIPLLQAVHEGQTAPMQFWNASWNRGSAKASK